MHQVRGCTHGEHGRGSELTNWQIRREVLSCCEFPVDEIDFILRFLGTFFEADVKPPTELELSGGDVMW